MIIDEKYIAKRINEKFKAKYPVKFKHVRVIDIERIIRYYTRVLLHLIKLGAFITLPTHTSHQKVNNIRIAPNGRRVVQDQFVSHWKRLNYMIRNNIKQNVSPPNP
jgi:hypothetical protein